MRRRSWHKAIKSDLDSLDNSGLIAKIISRTDKEKKLENALEEILRRTFNGNNMTWAIPFLIKFLAKTDQSHTMLVLRIIAGIGDQCIESVPSAIEIFSHMLRIHPTYDFLRTFSAFRSGKLIKRNLAVLDSIIQENSEVNRRCALHCLFNGAMKDPLLIPYVVENCRKYFVDYEMRRAIIPILLELNIPPPTTLEIATGDFECADLYYFSKLILYFAKHSKGNDTTLAISGLINRFKQIEFVLASIPLAMRGDCEGLKRSIMAHITDGSGAAVKDSNVKLMCLEAMKTLCSSVFAIPAKVGSKTVRSKCMDVRMRSQMICEVNKCTMKSVLETVEKIGNRDILGWFLATRGDVIDLAACLIAIYQLIPNSAGVLTESIETIKDVEGRKTVVQLFRASKVKLHNDQFCRKVVSMMSEYSTEESDLLYIVPVNIGTLEKPFACFLLTCAHELIIRLSPSDMSVRNRIMFMAQSEDRELRQISSEILSLL